MPAAAIKQVEYDPKREILDRLGDISGIEIAQNELLVAIFMRNKTASGIILTSKEDRYQGKACLVVKMGSACRFVRKDPSTNVEYGLDVKLHDWVVVRPSDTWTLDVNSDPAARNIEDFVPCRLVYDDQIRMRITSPTMVW